MIRTRSHPLVRLLKDVRDGRDKSRIFSEGVKLADELIASSIQIEHVFISSGLEKSSHLSSFLRLLSRTKVEQTPLDPKVMEFVSDLDSPPGMIVLAKRPVLSLESLLRNGKNPLLVVMDKLQSPSNVGAVARAAEAAGAAALVQTHGGADPYGPKALRASAGSAFRLPMLVESSLDALLTKLEKAGVKCVAADPKGKISHREWDWTTPTALVLGEESAGLSRDFGSAATIFIPMRKPVESLNVAVAAGIILEEAFHQRSHVTGDGN